MTDFTYCLQNVLDISCKEVFSACTQTTTWLEKSPFSLLQKEYTRVYDLCNGKIVVDTYFYDLNHIWGTAFVLASIALVLFLMLKLDKNDR